jgi:hypothetical protein
MATENCIFNAVEEGRNHTYEQATVKNGLKR